MRISVREGDAGHPAYIASLGKKVRVFLNDVESEEVVTADEEAGEIVRYVLDERGELRVNLAIGDAITETVYGKVRIEIN